VRLEPYESSSLPPPEELKPPVRADLVPYESSSLSSPLEELKPPVRADLAPYEPSSSLPRREPYESSSPPPELEPMPPVRLDLEP